MAVSLTTPNTLLGAYAPKSAAARATFAVVTVVLGSLLLALAGKISVPVLPVPFTLQTLAVAALAAAFGARIGVATIVLYIVEGLSGLPVFTNGGGPAYALSPTFGFILGWVPMAFIIGTAADRGLSRRLLPLVGVMLAADALCLVFGFAWLLVVANVILQQGGALPAWLDASNLIATGFNGAIKPFLIWDALKMAFAAVTVAGAWAVLRPTR